MSGGANDSSSSSKPLSPLERQINYQAAYQNINGSLPGGINNASSQYVPPTYQQANVERLNNGDYNNLEQQLVTARTAPLQYQLGRDQINVDADAAKRGIWSSGLAIQSGHDLVDKYAPQLRAAAADASAARYGLQAGDINAANQLNQANAAGQNTFNMANAQQNYASAWQPANYLKDLYNGTGGQISSGSGGGFNFSI